MNCGTPDLGVSKILTTALNSVLVLIVRAGEVGYISKKSYWDYWFQNSGCKWEHISLDVRNLRLNNR